MTDTQAIRSLIDKSGLKLKYIAGQLNITPVALARKIENKNEFKQSEIVKLREILNIKSMSDTERYFFAH